MTFLPERLRVLKPVGFLVFDEASVLSDHWAVLQKATQILCFSRKADAAFAKSAVPQSKNGPCMATGIRDKRPSVLHIMAGFPI
jgi:hypothetical protein